MEKDMKFCQSCGMPLNDQLLGTNADGSKNEDYCIYCYKDGAFTADCNMEQMAEFCAQFVDDFNKNTGKNLSRDEYKAMLLQFFPTLRRWKKMDSLISYCGINCEKCDAYIATKNNDQALREKTAKLWSEMNNSNILPEHINCDGCRADGKKLLYCDQLCEIRKCAMKKNIDTCGACPEIRHCKTLKAVTDHCPDNLKNLGLTQ